MWRAGGDGHRQVVVVETGQVHLRTAAPQDEDGVAGMLLRLREGGDDGRRRLFALHQGFVQVQPEGIARLVLQQVPPEIAVSRRGLGRDDGQTVRQARERQLLLHFQIAAGGELLDGLLLRQRLLPHREGRVDVVDEQGHPEHLAETDLHPHEDRDARLQRLAGLVLEEGLQLREVPFPDHGPDVGHRLPAVALGEVQVAVPVGPGTPGADLRLHPIALRKGVFDPFLHAREQLGQFQIVLCHGLKISRPPIFPPSGPSGPARRKAPCRRMREGRSRRFALGSSRCPGRRPRPGRARSGSSRR